MKKAIIIHGWGGSPNEAIHKYLKRQLEAQGFNVQVPEMPNTEAPEIKTWIDHLKDLAPNPDKETFFIGHSVGCQTILRYLEKLPETTKVGGVVMIAPWMHLLDTAYENPEEEKEIAKPWLETPIDWEKIKSRTDHFVAIFSDNDFCVPLSDKEIFKEL
ncbi:MAG: alpha/beta fold hydrolase, partial [Nanoarchaeota archaeon]|nr:alpha/beta fold hydrolase [Nanoarchaeota archaeon]